MLTLVNLNANLKINLNKVFIADMRKINEMATKELITINMRLKEMRDYIS